MPTEGSSNVVLAALAAAAGLAAAKLDTVLLTGSSSMLSSTVHSLVDASSLALLLYGTRRATASAGEAGGGDRELYFWGFVSAILLYAMGAGVALYEGVESLSRPQAIGRAEADYVVLTIGLVVAAAVIWIAMQRLDATRSATGPSRLTALHLPANAALCTVIIVAVAAFLGQAIALAGLVGTQEFELAGADGVASLAIGLVLASVAAIMAIETKRLLRALPTTPAGITPADPGSDLMSAPITASTAPEPAMRPTGHAAGTSARTTPLEDSPSAGIAAPQLKPTVVIRPKGKRSRGKRR